MKLTGRLYTRYFSQHKFSLLIAAFAFALSLTPLARLPVQYAVDENLVFTLRYVAFFSLLVGFRGNYPALVSLHKVVTVLTALVPTLIFVLGTQLILLMVIIGGIVSFLAGTIETEMLRSIFEAFAFWVIYADATAAIWLLVNRVVFKQYRYPYDTDAQNKFAVVAGLLFFFGFFGVHRFYVGKTKSGILYMGTMGLLGVGILWDALLLLLRRFTDAGGKRI